MKRAIAIALMLSLGLTGRALPQGGETDAHFFKQAFDRVRDSVGGANKLAQYGYVDGVSILGAWVTAKDYITFTWTLTGGVNYMFLAAGDQDAQDIGLQILDSTNKVVASENRKAPDALVNFNPPATGRFTMKLTLAQARVGNNGKELPCVCSAALLRENGINVPLKDLDDSADALIKLFVGTDKILKEKDRKALRLRTAVDQWAVYGAVLKPGENASVTNMDLGAERRLFLSLGDKNTRDVNLYILDNKGDRIAQDTKEYPEAIIGYTPVAGQRYGIRMINFVGVGNGPAVVLTGVFDVMNSR